MLTVTENAQAVVKGLTSDNASPTAGLRIARDQDQLAVRVVAEPQPSDVVVDAGEARVYLAEDTAPTLEDQTLDATQTPEGIGFTLAGRS
ncbi:Fe-S cluster assembly protein HesB [Intrasporangium sp.]|uniref:Fe-S cluster assembly protein HesB n=1 Tax=Intrasporangium sp. TaxID=1925024 RepID=UPI00293B6174|nr:Fe-S cluster assembly protein HesB [Intrasporangium sp.]MDV3220011.1 Fe-S cluster assembly protein HesB [Intrasporangium sp.]